MSAPSLGTDEPGGLDVAALRAATPGCREGFVFLNSAGSSLASQAVLDAQVAHLRREAEVGGYLAEAQAADALQATRQALAELVGAGSTDEIGLVGSASEAWKLAFYGIDLGPTDRILVGRAAYGANAIAMLQREARTGATVEVVDDDAHGQIDLDALEQELSVGDVAVVCLTHVPTGGGLVNPAAEVGRLCREHDVLYLLDACQSAGQIPLDVAELGCHALSATGRKYLRGPRGTGFLWMEPALLQTFEPPVLDNQSASWSGAHRYTIHEGARRFETYESAVAARVGLGVAVREALDLGIDRLEARISWLAAELRARLAAVDGVTVHDTGLKRCGIVTFSLAQEPAGQARARLRAAGVEMSVSARESSRWLFDADAPDEVLRASVHAFNTLDELDRAVQLLTGS